MISCTFRVENRSDAQIEKDIIVQDNFKLVSRCRAKCDPFGVMAFLPHTNDCVCWVE